MRFRFPALSGHTVDGLAPVAFLDRLPSTIQEVEVAATQSFHLLILFALQEGRRAPGEHLPDFPVAVGSLISPVMFPAWMVVTRPTIQTSAA